MTNLKSIATEAQAIFTNGKISYSCEPAFAWEWTSVGKGDIDIIASNFYMGCDGVYDTGWWKTIIPILINAFGADGTYISEFGLSTTSLNDYSTDEAVQAAGITEMINFIKASGMTRAIAFIYRGYTPTDEITSNFGILKTDGTYRELWQSLLNSGD
jgi:hypothetical protein